MRISRCRAWFGIALTVAALASGADGVRAEVSDDLGVTGQLQYTDETGEKRFAEGVDVSIADIGGDTTDAEGQFRIQVPAAGEYVISLDIQTLPDGVVLRDPERATLNVIVSENRDLRVIFPLITGEATTTNAESQFAFRRISQLTVEGLKLGLYLAMAAIGLSLIFGTTGLVNFAHAEMITWGALMAYFFNVYGLVGALGFMAGWPAPLGGGVNFVVATLLAIVLGGVLGYVLNRMLFRTARNAGVSLLAQMIMTIGLSILLRHVFLYFFSGRFRVYRQYSAQRANQFFGIEITTRDIAAMLVSIIVLVAVGIGLTRTRTGRAMRAVADNRDLAESSGIDVEKVIAQVWILGGALAALAGSFFGFDQVKWDLGTRILLLIFASVTLGGLGTAFGALVGALIVGLVINLSTLVIDSELKNMTALFVLILALLLRPQGILGKKQRIG